MWLASDQWCCSVDEQPLDDDAVDAENAGYGDEHGNELREVSS